MASSSCGSKPGQVSEHLAGSAAGTATWPEERRRREDEGEGGDESGGSSHEESFRAHCSRTCPDEALLERGMSRRSARPQRTCRAVAPCAKAELQLRGRNRRFPAVRGFPGLICAMRSPPRNRSCRFLELRAPDCAGSLPPKQCRCNNLQRSRTDGGCLALDGRDCARAFHGLLPDRECSDKLLARSNSTFTGGHHAYSPCHRARDLRRHPDRVTRIHQHHPASRTVGHPSRVDARNQS